MASLLAVHIRVGSYTKPGKLLYPLPGLTVDANGDVSATATFTHAPTIPAADWFVSVQFAGGTIRQQGQTIPPASNPLVCGNVTLRT